MTTNGRTADGSPASRSALRAIGLTTAATVLGYAVTLLQQAIYARSLGVSAETDSLGAALAWAVGTTGPVGTTLATVFLPRYVRAANLPDERKRLRVRATTVALGVGIAMALATNIGAPWLAAVLIPGGETTHRETLADLLRIAAPLEITWPLVWVTVSTANARERYVLAAASMVLPPLPVIGVLLTGTTTVEAVAVAYVAGTILQLLALWTIEPDSRPLIRAVGKPEGSFARDLVPVGAAMGLLSLISLEVRSLASLHVTGDVAIADYASRLVIAGQQILLSGLLAVTFTRWSSGSDPGRPVTAIDSARRTLGWVAIAGVILIAALPLLAVPLTQLAFVGGRFTESDASVVGTFIGWMGPGVAGHMLLMVALRALFAEGRVRPVILAAVAACTTVLVVGLVGQAPWGLNGVAVAYSAAYLAAGTIACVAVLRGTRDAAARLTEGRAFPIPPRDASLLAAHEDVR